VKWSKMGWNVSFFVTTDEKWQRPARRHYEDADASTLKT